MKRFSCLVLALLLMLFSAALADDIDLKSMSDEELVDLIYAAREEIDSRKSPVIAESNVNGRFYQLVNVEMSTTLDNTPMLLLTFNFTNGDEMPVRAQSSCFLDARQNKKLCDLTLRGVGIPSGQFERYVEVGETDLFYLGVELLDIETPVDFELSGYSTPKQNWTMNINEIPPYQAE